jgi:hypothetical protein
MKQILIEKKNGPPIILTDDDDTEISDYTKKCSELLELSNVSIIETSSSSAIIRPKEVTSIVISELSNEESGPVIDSSKTKKSVEANTISDDEDYITDEE